MYHKVFVIVLFTSLISAGGTSSKDDYDAIEQKCSTETGANLELLTPELSKKRTSDPIAKCFTVCVNKALGYLKADGTYNLDRAIAKFPADYPQRDAIVANLTKCVNQKGDNECESGYESIMCVLDVVLVMDESNSCMKETGANTQLIVRERSKKRTSDPIAKCYEFCIHKAAGYLKADGTYNLDKQIELIPPLYSQRAEMIANLTKCAAQRGTNECDTGYENYICVQEVLQLYSDQMAESQRKCFTETGANHELVLRERSTERTSDPIAKCYEACIYKALGFLKADGTYDLDGDIAKIPANYSERDTVIASLTECVDKSKNAGANECETGYENVRCMLKAKATLSIVRYKTLIQKCITESGIDPKLSETARLVGQNSDPKVKCYRFCYMREMGLFEADGTFNLAKAAASLTVNYSGKATVMEKIKECAAKTGTDQCDTAYEILTCFTEKKIGGLLRFDV